VRVYTTTIYDHLNDAALRDPAAYAAGVIARAIGDWAKPPPLLDNDDETACGTVAPADDGIPHPRKASVTDTPGEHASRWRRGGLRGRTTPIGLPARRRRREPRRKRRL